MSVPFKFKQFYRDLYDYLSNSKPTLQAPEFDLFARMLNPQFPTSIVSSYAEKTPMNQDTFLSFVAEGQKATAEPYDTLLWKYVANAVKYNLFAGEDSMVLKDFRSMIDSSLKMYKKDAELTTLYQGACPAAAASLDTASITPTEVSAFLLALSKSVSLFDCFKTLLPKKRGGKTTNVPPPALGDVAGGSAPPPPPPASEPASPVAPKTPAVAAPTPAAEPASPGKPYTDARPATPPPAEPPAATAVKKPETPTTADATLRSEPSFSKKEDVKSPLTPTTSFVPPPPPLEDLPPPPPPAEDPPSLAASPQQQHQQQQVSTTPQKAPTRRPSMINGPSSSSPGGLSAFKSLDDGQQQNGNSNTVASGTTTTQQQQGPPPISSALQRLANEQQAAVSLFPHHNAAVAGGILPLPKLPSEVLTYVTELDRQRQLLLERLEAETAQLNDANAAVAVLKSRIQQLSTANAAYFAAASLTNTGGGDSGNAASLIGLPNLTPADQALLEGTQQSALAMDPAEAAALSPFYQLQMNRQRLQQRMEEWLEHAKAHNGFLRQEVMLAREGYRYDKSSAALAAHREHEQRYYWASNPSAGAGGHASSPPSSSGGTISFAGDGQTIGGFAIATAATMPPAVAGGNAYASPNSNGRPNPPANFIATNAEHPTAHGPPVGTADVMSPYRIARFYSEMAKRDKELEEKQRLLHAMNAIEAREHQLATEIAAYETGNAHDSGNNGGAMMMMSGGSPVYRNNQQPPVPAGPTVSIIREDPSAYGMANNSAHSAMMMANNSSQQHQQQSGQQQGGTSGRGLASALPDHLFYNTSSAVGGAAANQMSAAQRYQQANSMGSTAYGGGGNSVHSPLAAVHSSTTSGQHYQRRDPAAIAREQQRRMAVEQLALQQQQQQAAALGARIGGGAPQQQQQPFYGGGGGYANGMGGRSAIISNVEQYLRR